MARTMESNAEYQALDRFITADKRYRRFVYALTFCAFIFLLVFASILSRNAIAQQREAVAKAATANNKYVATVARETIRYNTCILLISIDQRKDPAIQQKCFNNADLPGGLRRSDFVPFILNAIEISGASNTASAPLVQLSSQDDGVTSSPNTTPQSAPMQSDKSQPVNTSPQPAPPPSANKPSLLPITTPCINVGGLPIC